MPKVDKKKRFDQIFGADTPQDRQRIIQELDLETPDPLVTVRLNQKQVRMLADYIGMLPQQDFQILCLHYCLRYSDKRIKRELGLEHIRGIISYNQDRLTQCMNLSRPIREHEWRIAAGIALDIASVEQRHK